MAKRRMLILVRYAQPPAPSDSADESDADDTAAGFDASDADKPKSERKTGFIGVGGTAVGSGASAGSATAPAMIPIGSAREIVRTFAPFNIAPDGSGPHGWGETYGMATLYGPGCVVELPYNGEPDNELSQAMVSVTDDEFAWPVLSRACKAGNWKLMDPDSGRTFG
ncbi:MAG: hypothetical protein KF768_02065 [Phycisphaeraceae bacterium]|nr:hypothetical protein [Phycisphaeraceae bacterium]